MAGESSNLALFVPGETELGTRELLQEVRFGFGKKRESTEQDAVAAGVLSAGKQLSAFAPHRHLQPFRKRGAGGDFVAADTGIQDVGAELDDDGLGSVQHFDTFIARSPDDHRVTAGSRIFASHPRQSADSRE